MVGEAVSDAREVVLARVRAALIDRPASVAANREAAIPPSSVAREAIVNRFVETVQDYGATVVEAADVRGTLDGVLADRDIRRIGVAVDLEPTLRPTSVEVIADTGLSPRELDVLDGVVTTCAVACADTGTIAFDGGSGQGRRALTLVPDLHVCVLARSQILDTFEELLAQVAPAAREGRPIVLVSGPSATSDIELDRVEGVHGPRSLVIILTDG